jgi:DNA polymerase-3 subunit epsilon
MKKKYAIIDVETTGGKASRDRVLEIAIVLHDGEKIIESWESLINPETWIPGQITQLTGITSDMVEDAPKFYEVARKVVEMTEGAIFVAHNARFDYSFIVEEFKRLGYTYSRRKLCTVRLARQTMPGLPAYGLDALSRYFKIKNDARHRAMGDVQATIKVLENLLQKDAGQAESMINLGIREALLPVNLDLDKIHALPEAAGVYYFYNKKKEVVYVGKSVNIQKRVASHFADKTEKARRLQEQVHDISYELTGTELLALIFESYEIKRLLPGINRAQRTRVFNYGLFSYYSQAGYLCFGLCELTAQNRKKFDIIAEFAKPGSAKGKLSQLRQRFTLCEKLLGLSPSGGACFHYHIEQCTGACVSKESPETYNERAEAAKENLAQLFDRNFFIIDQGREDDECSVILIEDGRFQGYGYLDRASLDNNPETLRNSIKTYANNPEANQIVYRFMAEKPKVGLVEL